MNNANSEWRSFSVKKRTILVVLTVCLVLAGCTKVSSQGHNMEHFESSLGFDAQNQYMLTTTTSFQETNDFFCGSNYIGNYIKYYDKISGISGTLCADPTCMHDSSDCGAYMQAGATLSCYDGMFYWIAQDIQGSMGYYLWRGDLSGMNREKVKQIGYEDIILTYQPQQYVVHRGNLYILGRNDIVDGAKSLCRVSLLSTPLNGTQEFTTLYDETFDCNVISAIRFRGAFAFLHITTFPQDGSSFHVTVSKIDLHSGNTEIVFEEAEISESPGTLWVTEQGEFYLPGADDTRAYVWKLENNERVQIVSASWSGGYPSIPYIMDEAAVCFTRIDDVLYTRIINLSGETLYDGKLFPEGITGIEGDPNKYTFTVVGGDSDKLILNLQGFTGTGLVDYTIMLDVTNNMKPTLLWSSQG